MPGTPFTHFTHVIPVSGAPNRVAMLMQLSPCLTVYWVHFPGGIGGTGGAGVGGGVGGGFGVGCNGGQDASPHPEVLHRSSIEAAWMHGFFFPHTTLRIACPTSSGSLPAMGIRGDCSKPSTCSHSK